MHIIKTDKPAKQDTAQLIGKIRDFYEARPGGQLNPPLAHIRTYGCQQNVSDSEHIKGMLAEMGFGFTQEPENADLILFNTCAVREHAQDRVFGNVGALKNIKNRRPHTLIALCGCMVQQEHVAEKIKKSYPFVGLVFGTHVLHRFPELLYDALTSSKRVFEIPDEDGTIHEDIPVQRDGKFKAWLSIMYGCNNFCTYCIVPHVRGRERSRKPERILEEARELIQEGYKEITLLGQNVNSYGKQEEHGVGFPELLQRINDIPGDFVIRFMTSHPKDATKKLFDTISRCDKVARHFHLPFQSGSNRILKAMNRGYTREQYLELIEYARKVVPGISFTSDVIVGFPGETREDFEQTLDIIRRVGFTSLFTFIYSPRKGTPAAKLPDPVTREEKTAWFHEMTQVQEEIAASRCANMVGSTVKALIENAGEGFLEARLSENIVVRVDGDPSIVGRIAKVEITDARSWILLGKIKELL
ncbi:MAG: tRNA (N6-isopentenyl adenosine(37)-C2)-methylthiotransferase MiaB [Oscillospiraceae bacterium]|nr:tRNA (N6-isopentenyl adenosine(37)-C2)-methylthiotransferase MiaB [Oscillospiraceae bacterium]MDD4546699.1 tRNA (N6-isopentenyl adenosine(37)-C2)-methylthiotransferase MiaB [Oscillospiraceae bacterium]